MTSIQRLLSTAGSSHAPAWGVGEVSSFREADLRGAGLDAIRLRGIDLEGADLQNARMAGTDLTGARLRRADLRGAVLTGAHLISADLRQADLTGADLTGANLYRAHLDGTQLSGAQISGAGLNAARLIDARLDDADMQECKMVGAVLKGACLDRARLERAYLTEADLAGASLVDANLSQANLAGASLAGADLRGIDLRKANLQGIRGIPAARGNARISASTYRKSGWRTEQLVEWLQAGSVLVDPENLPRSEHQHLFAVQLGLTVKFQVCIQPADWFALYGLIADFQRRHPDDNLRVAAFNESHAATTVRILADDHALLARFADALCGRTWETSGTGGELITPHVRRLLSWLVDRIAVLELYTIEDEALRKVRSWSAQAPSDRALGRLLWAALPVTSRQQWMKGHAWGLALSAWGEDPDALARQLASRGLVNGALFASLLRAAPRHAQDIRRVAKIWAVCV